MKRMTLALAAIATGGAASAQSVTVFGIVDVGVSHYSVSGSASQTAMSNSGNLNSRIGFRGTEDLGGGLGASFWLEAPLTVDDGNANGLAFTRRSTVSLSGPWGEARLGRDYTPTYLNEWFDPFNATGSGTHAISLLRMSSTRAPFVAGFGANNATYFRTSNSVGYFLPANLGGVYGQLQYAFDEQPSTANSSQGRYVGGRIGYRKGPVNVALAAGKSDGANPPTATAPDVTSINLGGSYDFGPVMLMGEYSDESYQVTPAKYTSRGYNLGVIVPVGPGEIKAAYSSVRLNWPGSPKASKLALGYQHNLSKRTALYATVARLDNENGAMLAVVQGSLAGKANAGSTGYDLGIRHSF